MGKFKSKINKVMMALAVNHNEIYLLESRQGWSDRLEKPITKLILYKRLSQSEWNKLHPNKPTKADFKNDMVLETFKEIEVLLFLVEQLKAGDKDDGA